MYGLRPAQRMVPQPLRTTPRRRFSRGRPVRIDLSVRRPPRKPSALAPYLDYLQQRWDEGQHSARILHEELQAKGYLGHYQRVKMAVAPLRRGLPLDKPRERPPSPREAARWITTHPYRHHLHINDRLPRLLEHCPELGRTHDLVRRFAAMLDNRDATPLPDWLDDLAGSGLAPLVGLAGALREDQHAVAQGITTPYNSGVSEGRITDVKLRKRLMADRAGVPLLRHRVVLIAHLRRRYADRLPRRSPARKIPLPPSTVRYQPAQRHRLAKRPPHGIPRTGSRSLPVSAAPGSRCTARLGHHDGCRPTVLAYQGVP